MSRPIAHVSISSSQQGRRVVYIPYMIDHGFPLAAAMRHGGVSAEALPVSDERTLEIGRMHTTGKECYPSIITTGDIVKKTMASDFDPDHSAFFMPAAAGPCRFGQYNRLHRIILDEIGLQKVPILVFDQTGGYHNDLSHMGNGFRLNAWRSFIILDSIQKLVLERRPYEVNRGQTDARYRELLDELVKNVGQDGSVLKEFSRKARQALESVKIDRSQRRPRIGIVGEIFVRSNKFANDGLVQTLERLGAQVGVPPVEEWFDYIDHQRDFRYRKHLEGNWKDRLKQNITEMVMERSVEPLRKEFDKSIELFTREADTSKVIEKGWKYLTPAVEGEAVLSMGRVVEYAEHGFDGIINVIPFGCMPGTIVSLLLHQFRQDFGLPFLNVVVEGAKNTGQDIRFDAFIQQAAEHMKTHRKA